jgi:outer membrane protein OmpA-like peptidoglycan-associated protein
MRGIMTKLLHAIILLLFAILPLRGADAADVAGSRDHPLISRYTGSEIITYNTEAFDSYQLLTGKVTQSGGKAKNPQVIQGLEGKLTEITYRAPADRSTLEIIRNYETELKKNGFEEIFSCANETCGGMNFSYTVVNTTPMVGVYADQRYFSGKLKRDAGDVYVSLYINHNKTSGTKHANIQLDIIEIAPMQAGLVTVDAEAMAKEILKEGHIAIYGIYFDTDKATIKSNSKPTLQEITKLLQENPTLKLVIVGHTDNVGAFDYNMDLSKRRAQAVQSALVSSYGINGARLKAWGVGYLSPVASNKNEAGRAKNRRVELVEQ